MTEQELLDWIRTLNLAPKEVQVVIKIGIKVIKMLQMAIPEKYKVSSYKMVEITEGD